MVQNDLLLFTSSPWNVYGLYPKKTGNRFSKPFPRLCTWFSAVLASKPISASSPVEAGPLGPSPYSSDLNAMGKQPKTVDTLENLWNTFQVTEGNLLAFGLRCIFCQVDACNVIMSWYFSASLFIHSEMTGNFTDKCCKCSYTLSILIITCHDARNVLALELEWDECRNEHSKVP